MTADERLSETLRLLTSIDASLKQLVRQSATTAPLEVADARELDSQYGDPIVKFDPRDWTGDSYKGHHMSECPPDYLDLVAGAFDYFAKKAEEAGETTSNGKPVAAYKRKDAARARGWAKRHRERGWKPTPDPAFAGVSDGADDDGFGSEWNS